MELADIQPVDTSSVDRAPEPEQVPEPVVDVERQALDDDTRMLAQHAASLNAAEQQITQQLDSGLLDANTALAMRQNLQQLKQQAIEAARNLSNREQAHSKRRQREDEAEVLREIPQWANKEVRNAEVTALKDYLTGEKGLSQEQLSAMSAAEVVREYGKWEKVMKSRMSANERRLHEANEKIRAAKAANPDFGKSRAEVARERTGPRTGNPIADMQAEFKSAHGRELSRAELRAALITGEMPSK